MDTSINNEKELLIQVANGDEAAFRRLFDLYHNKLAAFILRFTRYKPVAQEIVQDVFMKIWSKPSVLLGVENFDSFLFVMARNHAFNMLKKESVEHERFKQWSSQVLEEKNGEEEKSLYKEYEPLIKEAVAQLPPQQQKVFILSKEEELSHQQIADQMGLSKETVKKHMALALKSVREYIAGRLHVEILLFLALTAPLFNDLSHDFCLG